MPDTIDSLKPGQNVRCTIVKAPRTDDASQTILRLMRKDAAISKGLRKSQAIRRRTTIVYNRGNRDWVKRQPVGKIAQVAPGATWTFTYTVELGRDLQALADQQFVTFQGL